MVSKRLAYVAAFIASISAPHALACWKDGCAAGKVLGKSYCQTLRAAYNSGYLRLRNPNAVSLCGGGTQGLSCKQAMADAVDADRLCRRLYNQDWANQALANHNYSARSLFDVYAQSCRDQDPLD